MTINQDEEGTTVNLRAMDKLRRDLGAQIMDELAHPKTVEIMLNPDGRLWRERLGERMECIGRMPAGRAEAAIKTLAGIHRKEITRHNPKLECELPFDSSRFAGQLPPIVQAPTFAIRKRAVAVFTLEQYVEAGIMTAAQRSYLRSAVRAHRNILIIGGTGSGKTTLVNALINAMVQADPTERPIIIEDTGEIQCESENCVPYHTSPDCSMKDILKIVLRMRPDRILVGEVRGAEALDMLMAWNSGHEGGAATLHANSAYDGLDKLAMYVSMNPDSPRLIEALIGRAVHVVVFIKRTESGRRIEEILEVDGYVDGKYKTQKI